MIVRDVMSKDVLLVGESDSALKIGNLMDSKLIGAALVVEDGQFRGIISKETFVSHLDKISDCSLGQLKVSDLMEADIDTVRADDDVKLAVELLLTQKGIVDRLPVLDGGKVVGMVSKFELTGLFAKEMQGRFRVADLMHYGPATVFDYTPLDKVVETIKKECVKRVLVLSGEKLVGIISVRDLSVILFRQRKECSAVDTTTTITAEDVMTRNPITVKKKLDASKAALIMVEKKIGGIPVVESRLEGILTRSDLLKGYQALGL